MNTKIVALIFVLVVLVVMLPQVWAFVTYVDSTGFGYPITTTYLAGDTVKFAHTVPAGDNRLLVVTLGTTSEVINGVYWNDGGSEQAFTQSVHVLGDKMTELWYLVAPAVGSDTIYIAYGSGHGGAFYTAMNFTNVNQSNPIGATGDSINGDVQIEPVVTMTTLYDSSTVVSACTQYGNNTGPYTPGAGIVELADTTLDAGSGDPYYWAGYVIRTGAGEQSFALDATGADPDDGWAMLSVEVRHIQGEASDTCCTVTTSPVAFGSVDTATCDTMSFTITNCGTDTYGGTVVAADLAAPYSMVESGGDLVWSLASDAIDTFHIIFCPTAVGEALDTLSAGHDSCAVIYISGTGLEVVASCCAPVDTLLAFGEVDTATVDTMSFTIENCGTEALAGTLSVADIAAPFSLVGDGIYNLAEDEIDTFCVAFAPTAVGAVSDSLGFGSVYCGVDVVLTGTGVPAEDPISGDNVFYIDADNGINSLARSGNRDEPYNTLYWVHQNCMQPEVADTVYFMAGTHFGGTMSPSGGAFRGDTDGPVGHQYDLLAADPLAGTMPIISAMGVYDNALKLTSYAPNATDQTNDVAYVHIDGLVIESDTVTVGSTHGLFIDDGGGSYSGGQALPAHHIWISNCVFRESKEGCHSFKFAGVDTFLIENCVFTRCHVHADFVGCHYGTVRDCVFIGGYADYPYNRGTTAAGAAIVMKGGSSNILVSKCDFISNGCYGILLGQATNIDSFRPEYFTVDSDGDTVNYEAKNLDVYGCIFWQHRRVIALQNAIECTIANCTVYAPEEYYDPTGYDTYYLQSLIWSFLQCEVSPYGQMEGNRDNYLFNNLYYFGNPGTMDSDPAHVVMDTNPDCLPSEVDAESHRVSYSLFYCADDTSNSMPPWAAYEGGNAFFTGCPANGMNHTGDPLFAGSIPDTTFDFMLSSGSPAAAAGSLYVDLFYDWFNGEYVDGTDFNDLPWGSSMSIGAFAAYADTCCLTTGIAFGSVYVDSTAVDSFRIYNCGDMTLIDTLTYSTWDAVYVLSTPGDSAYSIATGDTAWFVVEFTPVAAVSYPDTNAAGDQACTTDIIFSGLGLTNTCCSTIAPPYTSWVFPTMLFGSVYVDSTATDSFYIKNCGYAALVDSIDWENMLSVFTLTSDSLYNITAGDSVWFTVEFTPTATGYSIDTLYTGHDDCANVMLIGTALTNICCGVYTSPIAFGQVDTAQTAVDSFYIKNCLYEALVDSIDWDLDSVFTLTSDSLYNIAAGDSQWFTIQFIPTSIGAYIDTIDTGHDDCGDVILTGTGDDVFAPDTINSIGIYPGRRHRR